jgi:adenosylhomocysteine nucleosidase
MIRSAVQIQRSSAVQKKWTHLAFMLLLLVGACRPAALELDPRALNETPRVLVMSAFEAESAALLQRAEQQTTVSAAGHRFTLGRLGGKDVVMVQSGVSMVNAAMTAQAAVDYFHITAVVFSGIAGGVNPDLNLGDVVVPAAWGQHLESVFARQKGDAWDPGIFKPDYGSFGMIFPQPVQVSRPGTNGAASDSIFWFQADPSMLKALEKASGRVTLERCWLKIACLPDQPRLVVGGRGVSGPAFVDNAAYRAWLYQNFQADAVDMETAAVAQVAYVNQVPFLGFRSLSDLAGSSAGANEMLVFANLASRNAAAVTTAFLETWSGPVSTPTPLP